MKTKSPPKEVTPVEALEPVKGPGLRTIAVGLEHTTEGYRTVYLELVDGVLESKTYEDRGPSTRAANMQRLRLSLTSRLLLSKG